jgi:hypothetical protein
LFNMLVAGEPAAAAITFTPPPHAVAVGEGAGFDNLVIQAAAVRTPHENFPLVFFRRFCQHITLNMETQGLFAKKNYFFRQPP